MGRIVGIDLGTTNTAVAVIQDGRPRVIEDDRGYKVLPSVVSARGEGRFIVGQAAHNLILTHPDRTVYATKRLIGRRWDSPEVQRARERVQYQVREAPDGGVQVKVGDEWMSPAEVAAVVLQVARTITERAIGEPVDEAVITVPAHFNHQQRAQTMEAARLAGLKCDRLLNEPTAAALAYGHKKNLERTVCIFDLGGGTFDVTVLKLSSGVYEVLATRGDTYLGGEDFDYRLVDHLCDAFQAKSGQNVRNDRNALQRLKDAAERAKCDLSFSDRTTVVIPHILSGHNLETVLTRTTLESLTGDLVSRCIDITRSAVVDASLQLSDIDEVVLVGGQTRMPRVREAVSGLFGREPSRSVHPEEAVAIGAAVHASNLADPTAQQTVLLDVTPFDLGIDAIGGMFSVVVPKNSRVPAAESRTFATVHENQTSVRVTVRQGQSRVASENEFLGEFVLDGLTPAPRMQTKVDVTFKLDSNGMLQVTAVDRASGEKRNISVRNYADRARAPHMPSEDEARGDRDARVQRDAQAALAAVATPTAGAGAKSKLGILAAIFGGKKKAQPVAATIATPAPAVSPPSLSSGPAPAIDMSAVARDAIVEEGVDPEELAQFEPMPSPAEDDEDDATAAAIAEEEDLYGRDESATFGLGGTREPGRGVAPRPNFGADKTAGEDDLDASELFAGLGEEESSDDPITEAGARAPSLDGFGGDQFGSDPFGGSDPLGGGDPFGASDPFRAGPTIAPTVADPFGATPPAPTAKLPEPAPEPEPVRATFAPPDNATIAPAASGLLFEGMLGDGPPTAETTPDDAPLLGSLPPATPRVAAPMVIPDNPEIDPFDTSSAAALSADIFAGAFDDGGELGGSSAPAGATGGDTGSVFDESPTNSGVKVAAPPLPTPRSDVPAAPAPTMPLQAVPASLVAAPVVPAAVVPSLEPAAEPKKRKPARLKLHYREKDAFVAEYRDNLRRGGTFIKTEKPLAVGRECVFEIDAPGLVEPLLFEGVVTMINAGDNGETPGMSVDYRMDAATLRRVEQALDRL